MKFCPECGSGIGIGSVKFCTNCGNDLWQTPLNATAAAVSPSPPPSPKPSGGDSIYQDFVAAEEEPKIEQGQDFVSTHASATASTDTVYSLGVKLEELVENILKNKDYSLKEDKNLGEEVALCMRLTF